MLMEDIVAALPDIVLLVCVALWSLLDVRFVTGLPTGFELLARLLQASGAVVVTLLDLTERALRLLGVAGQPRSASRETIVIGRPNLRRIRRNLEGGRETSGTERRENLRVEGAAAAQRQVDSIVRPLERAHSAIRPGKVGGRLSIHAIGAHCPVCGDDMSEQPVSCLICATPHHSECWQYNKGCAVFGCGADRAA